MLPRSLPYSNHVIVPDRDSKTVLQPLGKQRVQWYIENCGYIFTIDGMGDMKFSNGSITCEEGWPPRSDLCR